MTDQTLAQEDNHLLIEGAPDAPVSRPMGVAMIALNMALKYHDINTVQDGALYQQYKLEGRNMRDLQLDHVFETAIRIEHHLLLAEERIQQMLIEGVMLALEDGSEPEDEETAPRTDAPDEGLGDGGSISDGSDPQNPDLK